MYVCVYYVNSLIETSVNIIQYLPNVVEWKA